MSNFTAVVGPCGAKNQKMVLTNVVQDAVLYLNMKNQHVLQKFPYPTVAIPMGRKFRTKSDEVSILISSKPLFVT